MSIYDKSSLVLIPSGTKTGKVFSQKPTNGDGDFTFTRSTAATRVNADGNIEKETENKLLQSNQFDTTWSLDGSTITGGQTGYDGSNNAWLFSKTSSFDGLNQALSQSGVITTSIYAKIPSAENDVNSLLIRIEDSSGNSIVVFNLTNNTQPALDGNAVAVDKVNVGNGWYRCSLSVNATISRVNFRPAIGTLTGASTGTILFQDAQLEQGLVARDYIETTTSAVYGGITDNVPRLDYTDSSCPALLLEPLRTNGITHSEYIKAIGSTQNITLLNNASVNPQGLQYATEAVPFQNTSSHIFYKSGMGNAANTFTQSIYAKANGYNFCFIRFDLPTTSAWFDLENGVVGQTQSGITSTIVDAGNGWYRCTATLTTTQYANAVIGVSNQDGAANFAANGTSSVLFWGWQSELGAYATSYIPTYGSSVTRGKDDCTLNDAASVIANAKGSFYIEGKIDFLDTNGIIPLTAGIGTADLFYLWIRTNGVVSAEWYNGALQAAINSNINLINVGDSFKMAVAYQDNDFVLYINGTLIGTDTSGNAPYPTLLRIGKYNVDNYTGGSYTNAMVFPTRLSNQELQDLTTL